MHFRNSYNFMFQANHDFDPNTCYGIFLSPRFGYIRAVYALRSIRRGEEITVNYGYNVKTVGDCHTIKQAFTNEILLQQQTPLWYRRLWVRHVRKAESNEKKIVEFINQKLKLKNETEQKATTEEERDITPQLQQRIMPDLET